MEDSEICTVRGSRDLQLADARQAAAFHLSHDPSQCISVRSVGKSLSPVVPLRNGVRQGWGLALAWGFWSETPVSISLHFFSNFKAESFRNTT